MRITAGQQAPGFTVTSLDGRLLSLDSYRGRWLLLQFYRYASCPMCDLRLHDFARAYPPLAARGLEVIAFFHSPAERLRRHFRNRPMPFPLVADPQWDSYRRYGVERSLARFLLTMLKPGFYRDWARSMAHGFWGGVDWRLDTMPADFLIGPDQTVRLVHYGRDFGDHMPVAVIEAAVS